MRYTLLILFIFQLSFSQTIDKSNLLKDIDETHDNGKPKKVDYKNFDLKVVLTETYDESGDITSSYQFNPETGKRNGEFFDFPLKNLYPEGFKNYDGSFDFENPKNVGEYDEGVLIKCDNCTFYMYDISRDDYKKYLVNGSVKNGFYFGKVSVSRIYESSMTVKDNEGSRILSYDRGSNVNLYYKTGSGNWYKRSFYDISFSESGRIDDGEIKFYRDISEKNFTKIIYKNSKVQSILNYYNLEKEPRDSLNRHGRFWKINNEFVKNTGWYFGKRFDPLNIEPFLDDRYSSDDQNYYIKKFNPNDNLDYRGEKIDYKSIDFYDYLEQYSCWDENSCYKWSIGNVVFLGSNSSSFETVNEKVDFSSYYYGIGRYPSPPVFFFSEKVGVDFVSYDKLDNNGIYSQYNYENFKELVENRIDVFRNIESFFKNPKNYSDPKKNILFNEIDEFNNQYEGSNVFLYDYNLDEKNYVDFSPKKEKELIEGKLILIKENLKKIETDFYKRINNTINLYNLTKELFIEINSFGSNYIRLNKIDDLWDEIFLNSNHPRYGCFPSDHFTLIKLMKFYSSNEIYLDDTSILFKKMLENNIISFNTKEFEGGVNDIQEINWGDSSYLHCRYYFKEQVDNLNKLRKFFEELKRIKKIDKLNRFYKYLSKTNNPIESFFKSLNFRGYQNEDYSIYNNFRIDDKLNLVYRNKDLSVITNQLKETFENYQN